MSLIFLVFGRGGRFYGSAPRFSALKPFLALPSFWVLAGAMGLMLGATMGVFSILPTFLVAERGLSQQTASALVGVSRTTVLAAVFLSGLIVDRLGARRSMLLFAVLAAALTLFLGMVSGAWLVAAAFLQPVMGACFFPAVLSALSGLGPEESRNLVYSTTFPIVVTIGGGLIPSALGLMGDHWSFASGIVGLGLLPLLTIPLVRIVDL